LPQKQKTLIKQHISRDLVSFIVEIKKNTNKTEIILRQIKLKSDNF